MGLTIAGATAFADSSGSSAAVAIDSALQAQVATAQVAAVNALFGSIGLGANTNTSA